MLFDQEEERLLDELANDLAYGINALRESMELRRAQTPAHEMALFPSLNPNVNVQVDRRRQGYDGEPGRCQSRSLRRHPVVRRHTRHARSGPGPLYRRWHDSAYLRNAVGENGVLQWTMRGTPDLGRAFLYSTDITRRKQAEQSLQRVNRSVTGAPNVQPSRLVCRK